MRVAIAALLTLVFAVVGLAVPFVEAHAYAPSKKPFGNVEYFTWTQPWIAVSQTNYQTIRVKVVRPTPSQSRPAKAKWPAFTPTRFNPYGSY